MNKSPSQAVRKATIVPAFGGNQSLSDVVRAAAGHTEAKQDVLLGAVYSAYFQALKHGNKNQLQGRESSLFEQAKMYSVQTKAKAAGFPQPKKAAEYYSAHLCALEGVGMPGKASADDIAAAALERTAASGGVVAGNDIVVDIAEALALAYVDMVDSYLGDIAATAAAKRAETKASNAQGKADKDGVAAADAVAAATAAANEAKAITVPVMTLADMVAAVAAALRTGVIDDAEAGVLADAADEYNALMQTRETAALLSAPVASVVAQAEAVQ